MHILMLSNEFPPTLGGVQTHVYELSHALVKRGHQVTVFTRHHDPRWPCNEIIQGIHVMRLSLSTLHLLYDWQLRRAIKQLHLRQPVSIIHVHGMRPLDATRQLSIPVVFTNHTSGFLRRITQGTKRLHKMARQLAHCARVIAPSQELVDATRAAGYTGPCQFITNGVDAEKFSSGDSPWRTRLGISTEAFVVVLARRLVEKNGVLYFAEALKLLDNPSIHVLVAGDGADRGAFEAIIEKTAIEPRVHMLGGVNNTEMPAIYRAGNCAVLPSLMEATSIAGLEAMSSGLPLIGTRVGGIPVIIDDHVTGLLVEPRDPAGLAQAICLLASAPEMTKKMSRQAIDKVQSQFTWARVADTTLAAYSAAGASESPLHDITD